MAGIGKDAANEYGDGAAWFRGPIIGKGSFGRVYKATLKNPTSKYSCFPSVMAVKSAEVSCSGTIQKEKEVLSNLNNISPYLIKCFGDETTMGENGVMAYNLLLEYGSGGTLAERIEESGGHGLPELEVKMHTRSILRGLNHIHGTGYVHCDLKPDNILLVPNGRKGGDITEFRAKIGDFGLAKRLKDSRKRKLEPYWRGTPMYLSPEAVINNEQEAPSDVWAVGCIVLEMLTGKPVWDEKNAKGILAKVGAKQELPKIPDGISKDARDFLKCSLVRKSAYRFTCEMLLNHTFVDGLDSDGATEESGDFDQLSEIKSMALVYESDYEFSDDALFQEEWCDASKDDSSSYWCDEKESEVVEGEGVISAKQNLSQSLLKRRKHCPVELSIPAGI